MSAHCRVPNVFCDPAYVVLRVKGLPYLCMYVQYVFSSVAVWASARMCMSAASLQGAGKQRLVLVPLLMALSKSVVWHLPSVLFGGGGSVLLAAL